MSEEISVSNPNPTSRLTQSKPRSGLRSHSAWVRLLMIALFTIIVILTLFLLIRGEGLKTHSGDSTITGVVHSAEGEAVVAEIFMIGGDHSTYSAIDGSFQLDGVAAGDITLVVGYQGMGVEIPLHVDDHSVMDIGTIQVQATVMP